MAEQHSAGKWIVRASGLGLLLVLCFLAGFSVITESHTAQLSRRSDTANRTSIIYQDARFWVSQEESLEGKYRLDPGPGVERLHTQAEQNLTSDLLRLQSVDPTSANQALLQHVLVLNASYTHASAALFQAVNAHQRARVTRLDEAIADPLFTKLQNIVYGTAQDASSRSLALTSELRHQNDDATKAIVTAFGAGIALLIALGLVIAYFRRRLNGALIAELERLSSVALTDPLTGLRNHRAFHEDLSRGLQSAGRNGLPISLVMLDLDKLKQVNDTLGHQAGDDRLRLLTTSIRAVRRGTDTAYRIGGDEFAVILDGTRALNALEFTQRLNASLAEQTNGAPVTASAGISDRRDFSDKDVLIREADFALVTAKRSGQDAVIYTPEMEALASTTDAGDQRHTRTLANALALAVDAKDSYTRSHSQTVSQLSAVIATELGFNPGHIAQMRLAGLLHDVGKIGIPDAILNKPAKLTDAEYEQMKTHSLLGYNIVFAADMPTEARWIRHHHERYDGRGYPDQISGETIPIESRIIFVADSFEAMTSDRPYRDAPGQEFAIDELRRCSGTQFDPEVVEAMCRTLEPRRVSPQPALAA
jgi:diguanylate cyclase (GGDEF)-like protein